MQGGYRHPKKNPGLYMDPGPGVDDDGQPVTVSVVLTVTPR